MFSYYGDYVKTLLLFIQCLIVLFAFSNSYGQAQSVQNPIHDRAATVLGQHAIFEDVSLWYLDTKVNSDQDVLVLLHSNSGTSELWTPQIKAFSQAGYRVIAFDRKGWGKSQALSPKDNGTGSISNDLDRLMTYLNIKRFHLLGIAGGGFAALDYASDHGQNLKSLIIAASSAKLSDEPMKQMADRIEIPGIRKIPTFYRELSASFRATNEVGTKAWIAIEERSAQPGAIEQQLNTPNTLSKISKIQTPTFVIAGGADLLAPPSMVRLWASRLPDYKWALMPEAGHALSWEFPEMFNQLVLDFLKTH